MALLAAHHAHRLQHVLAEHRITEEKPVSCMKRTKNYDHHPDMRPDYTMDQKWSQYTEADHSTWRQLFLRQTSLLQGRACQEYLDGIEHCGFTEHQIPKFEEVSKHLMARTGWQIVAVPGLIPATVFFEHLANRRFPVTYWIRKPEQMDYLEEPDLFHDLFGHVPLLSNPVFGDYIAAYGRGGVKATKLNATSFISRLFWYTVEFGLIKTPEGMRIYGAGIVSSRGETVFALESDSPNRIGFDIMHMMQTKNKIDDYQETYYVIENFEQLFDATRPDFTPYYEKLRTLPELTPLDILSTDKIYTRGTMEYAKKQAEIVVK